MKKAVTGILILVVSFGHHYDTIKNLLKSINSSAVVWVNDFRCEEQNAEREENSKKKELFNTFNSFLDNHDLMAQTIYYGNFSSKQSNNFSSCDYSREVYSPPEV